MTSSTAYLLVFHGSQDFRSQAASAKFTDHFREQLFRVAAVALTPPTPGAQCSVPSYAGFPDWGVVVEPVAEPCDRGVLVQSAFLECHPLPLARQIEQFIEIAQSSLSPPVRFVVLPVFLLPGVHVMEDIPRQISLVHSQPLVPLEVKPHLGAHLGLEQMLARQIAKHSMDGWVLLAHGSRRAGGNQPIATLAANLGITAAYWSVAPKLEDCLYALQMTGAQRIGILPYFLFPGGITDAIAQSLSELSAHFPNLRLTLTDPLNANPQLIDLLVDLAIQETSHN